ncbi:MAG: TetR/AcrR family transcriptional regulator [Egibacteraceae bacterium]
MTKLEIGSHDIRSPVAPDSRQEDPATTPGGLPSQAARAERILDAAGELLLRIGYRRVTVEDIAQRADVGKGTVYLHWKSKQELLAVLLLREIGEVMRELVDGMRRDVAEVRLHRVMRSLFAAIMGRPLAKALYTRDVETLGRLAAGDVGGIRTWQQTSAVSFDAYLDLLTEHGLLRASADRKTQDYALHATTSGFYLIEQFLPDELRLPLEGKADCLAEVVRLTFEPPGEPDPQTLRAVAPRAITLFDEMRAQCDPHTSQSTTR